MACLAWIFSSAILEQVSRSLVSKTEASFSTERDRGDDRGEGPFKAAAAADGKFLRGETGLFEEKNSMLLGKVRSSTLRNIFLCRILSVSKSLYSITIIGGSKELGSYVAAILIGLNMLILLNI